MKEERRFFLAIALSFLIIWGWTLLFPAPKKPLTTVAHTLQSDTQQLTDSSVSGTSDTISITPIINIDTSSVIHDTQEASIEARHLDLEDSVVSWSVSSRGGVLEKYELRRFSRGANGKNDRVELVGAHTGDTPGPKPLALAASTSDRLLPDLPMQVLEAGETNVRLLGRPRSPSLPPGLEIEKVIERSGEDRMRIRIRFRNPTLAPMTLASAQITDPIAEVTRGGSLLLHLGPDLGTNKTESLYRNEYAPTPIVGRPAMEVPSIDPPGFFENFLAFFGKKRKATHDVTWAGLQVHHFVMAVRREGGEAFDALFTKEDARIHLWILLPPVSLEAGAEKEIAFEAFWGPKETSRLFAFHPSLEPLDGMEPRLFPHEISIARWMVKFLNVLFLFTGNYGWAIILMTLIVKGALFPLSHLSFKSMAKMQALRPQMEKIQKDFAKDKERLQRETMRLYQEAGVNPFGGCLPLLLQMPILVGLFYSLQSSIFLRREPFIFWIHDLSVPDTVGYVFGIPINIAAVVMTGTMFLQQKMMPMPDTPEAKEQRQMMTMMLFVMAFLFYSAPSGLTIYWTLQNLLSMLQQYWMMKGGKQVDEKQKGSN